MRKHTEFCVRVAWAIPVIVLAAVPAHAQTYDPRYPICTQVFSIDVPAIGCG
jgi:hypothetical protein